MEEGCQKPKRLSYIAKFKREVIRFTEKGNHKAAANFGVDESNIQLWWKHKTVISGVRHHEARLDCLWVMIYFARRG
jgi:hypothetical protein